jgi:hypothetical protein
MGRQTLVYALNAFYGGAEMPKLVDHRLLSIGY